MRMSCIWLKYPLIVLKDQLWNSAQKEKNSNFGKFLLDQHDTREYYFCPEEDTILDSLV
jgi:hypothetical protein